MTTAELAKRLSAVEQELARLRQERNEKPHLAQTLEKIHATFQNDDAFNEAMRLGRQWRKSQRPRSRRSSRAKFK